MFHIPLPPVKNKEIDYRNLKEPLTEEKLEGKVPTWPEEDGSIPKAPEGFFFHRIQEGDSLLSLSLRYGVSQSRLRKFNREACFGHQLGHMVGKLLLIPVDNKVALSGEAADTVGKLKDIDEQLKISQRTSTRPEDDEPKEPDEEGKYNLRRAFQYYATGVDDHRANYYLGEANWNVRQALKLYREDNQWEKQNQLCKLVPGLSVEQAKEILEICDDNVSKAVKYCKSKSIVGKNKPNEQDSNLITNQSNYKTPGQNANSSFKGGCLCIEQGSTD